MSRKRSKSSPRCLVALALGSLALALAATAAFSAGKTAAKGGKAGKSGKAAATAPVSDNGSIDSVVQPITDPNVNSPKEALRKTIFGDTVAKPGCATLNVEPSGSTKGLDKDLDKFLPALITALRKQDEKGMLPFFHQRLNIGLPAVATTFSRLNNIYSAPFDVTVYRLWALNTVDGTPTGLNCDERLTVFPQYGYPLQLGVWLQIMGQKELGRIFLSLVPADGKWNIGAFHAQQWTHAGQDFASWAEDAVKVARMGFKEAAFIKYDIAAKLLDGGGFIEIEMRDDIVKARDALMLPADWDKAIRAALPKENIVYTSTLLVLNGGGILVRMRTEQEISTEQLQINCDGIARTLMKQPWSTHAEGVRCNWVLPREDPLKEGALGGIFLSFNDVKNTEPRVAKP